MRTERTDSTTFRHYDFPDPDAFKDKLYGEFMTAQMDAIEHVRSGLYRFPDTGAISYYEYGDEIHNHCPRWHKLVIRTIDTTDGSETEVIVEGDFLTQQVTVSDYGKIDIPTAQEEK